MHLRAKVVLRGTPSQRNPKGTTQTPRFLTQVTGRIDWILPQKFVETREKGSQQWGMNTYLSFLLGAIPLRRENGLIGIA